MKKSSYSFQPQLKVDCYHLAQAPKLFVKKVSLHEVVRRWLPCHKGEEIPQDDAYYVECERHGLVNWKTTNVYSANELVARNNVFVVKFQR